MSGQGARDDEREAAWLSYRVKMLTLDGQNNLAGRGLVPSWRDWHAGWDAARSHPEPEITDGGSPGYLHLEDGSTFPRPALESDERHSPAHAIAWYGGRRLSRSQEVWLAACADAFGFLVANPEIARRKIPMIRRALARVPVGDSVRGEENR